eukprot:5975997-Amphidinium_carterae.2
MAWLKIGLRCHFDINSTWQFKLQDRRRGRERLCGCRSSNASAESMQDPDIDNIVVYSKFVVAYLLQQDCFARAISAARVQRQWVASVFAPSSTPVCRWQCTH